MALFLNCTAPSGSAQVMPITNRPALTVGSLGIPLRLQPKPSVAWLMICGIGTGKPQLMPRLRDLSGGNCRPGQCELGATLGVDPLLSPDELRVAYRQLCWSYHPDRLDAQELNAEYRFYAAQRLQQIIAAVQQLRSS